MHEHVDHNEGGNEPHLTHDHEGAAPHAAFPGTEPIEASSEATPPQVEPAPKKPSWAERRAAKRAATGGEEPNSKPRFASVSALPWDVRAKIAVVVSFVILVSVLIVKRDWLKGKSATKAPIASIGGKGDKAASSPKPAPPDAETEAETQAKAKIARENEEKEKLAREEKEKLAKAAAEAEAAKLAEEKAKADLPATPVAESPPPLPSDAEKDKVTESPADLPPVLTGVVKDEAKDKPQEPTPPSEIPPVLGSKPMPEDSKPATEAVVKPAETPPIETPKSAETPKPAEAPPIETPKPVETLPGDSKKLDPAPQVEPTPKPAEPPATTLPALAPAPPITDVSKETSGAEAGLTLPQIRPGTGFPIPKGRPRTSSVEPAKISSGAVETRLVEAPKPIRQPLNSAPAGSEGIAADRGDVYIVRRGDNFWTISKNQYGSGRYYKALWDANRDVAKTIEDLYVGTAIRIPDFDDLNKSLIEVPKTAARSAARPSVEANSKGTGRDTKALKASTKTDATLPVLADNETPQVKKTVPIPQSKGPRYREYVVRGRNETLRSIAKNELGDSDREDEIVKLNESRFEDDSYRLRIGMTLRLPADTRRQ